MRRFPSKVLHEGTRLETGYSWWVGVFSLGGPRVIYELWRLTQSNATVTQDLSMFEIKMIVVSIQIPPPPQNCWNWG